MARATSSFPDPLAPVMSTLAVLGATRATIRYTSSIFGLRPTIAGLRHKVSFGAKAGVCRDARNLRNKASSSSISKGLLRYSSAPPATERATVSTLAWAVITTHTYTPAAMFSVFREIRDHWPVQYRYPEAPDRSGFLEGAVRPPRHCARRSIGILPPS